MRFLGDENLPRPAITALRDLGHEVFYVRESAFRGEPDEFLVAYCNEHDLIMVTMDQGIQAAMLRTGLVLIKPRVHDKSPQIAALVRMAISAATEDDLRGNVTIVRPGHTRVRPLPQV